MSEGQKCYQCGHPEFKHWEMDDGYPCKAEELLAAGGWKICPCKHFILRRENA